MATFPGGQGQDNYVFANRELIRCLWYPNGAQLVAGRNGRGSGAQAFDKPSHVTLAGNLDYLVNDRNKRGQRRDFDMKVLDFLVKGSAQWTLAGVLPGKCCPRSVAWVPVPWGRR